MRSGRARGGEATLGTAHFDKATLAPAALDDRHRIARAAAQAWKAKRLLHALPPISRALKKELGFTIGSEGRWPRMRLTHRRVATQQASKPVAADTLAASLSFVLLVMPAACSSREHGQKTSRSRRICLSEKCLQLPAQQTFHGYDRPNRPTNLQSGFLTANSIIHAIFVHVEPLDHLIVREPSSVPV